MRKAIKACFLGCLLAATSAAPALAGGGGHGGFCSEELPALSEGWVAVGNNCFSPTLVSIDAGRTVRWQLEGYSEAHNVSFPDGPDSGLLVSSESFGVQFNAPGSYQYSCVYHPGMNGTVQVVGSAVAGPAMQTVSQTGVPIEGFDLAGGAEPATAQGGQEQMVIAFDPMAASIILLLGLPVSLGATFRLVGFAGPNSRIRPQLPFRREPKPNRDAKQDTKSRR